MKGITALSLLLFFAASLAQTLTVYSGRNEAFIASVVEQFEEETGLDVAVRYGDTAALAAQILEEGANTPADVFLAQDAGALGAIAEVGLLRPLSDTILSRVEPRFRSNEGAWVGVTGRARVLVVRTDVLEADYPESVLDLTNEVYRGRVGWAPSNGSFQAFVTAMRLTQGEEATADWLRAMVANDTRVYPNNTSIVEATGRGEVDFGLVNHYYLFRFLAEDAGFPAQNLYLPDADIGSLVNVAGAGVLTKTDVPEAAEAFVDFLLANAAQMHFATEVNEYPLVQGVAANPELLPLSELETPDLDLSDLADLEGTLELLQATGALE